MFLDHQIIILEFTSYLKDHVVMMINSALITGMNHALIYSHIEN